MNSLKRRLEGAKDNWAEELPNVLWAYQKTSWRSTGETPFSLTYGAEAVIPVEVNLCSARVSEFNTSQNDGQLMERLDLLEENRDITTIRLAEYQQKLARCYNQDVRVREFNAGDLVLRKVVGSMRDTNAGKLTQTCEGSYKITANASVGAYYLEDMNEIPLPWPWNAYNLKKFYQ